ncbi:unnamed protein product [Urochloa humidicola]
MGNCLNAASKRSHGGLLPEEEESLSEMRRISHLLLRDDDGDRDALEYHHHHHHHQEEAEAEEEVEPPPPPPESAEGLKVKVVLTRAELEWLMAQLKTGDGHSLRDVLHHMQAAKQGGGGGGAASPTADKGGWRPRLESILECQETLTY